VSLTPRLTLTPAAAHDDDFPSFTLAWSQPSALESLGAWQDRRADETLAPVNSYFKRVIGGNVGGRGVLSFNDCLMDGQLKLGESVLEGTATRWLREGRRLDRGR